MKAFHILAACFLTALGSVFAQPMGTATGPDLTNRPPISLWLPRFDTNCQAPATIEIYPYVLPMSAHPAKTVQLNFYANAQLLGSGEAVWHDEIRPDPHALRPQPMIIMKAGFRTPAFTWSNAPAGTFILTARAVWPDGWSASSDPITLTILPATRQN